MERIILAFNLIKDYLAIIYKYIISNNLNIDKGTFFTIIIGEVTVYGVILAFYQFLASYKFNENSIDRYLGIKVIDYYIYKYLGFFNRIISSKIFKVCIVLHIFYKPFLLIYENVIGISIIKILNFIWYCFAIFYFILFFKIFMECAKCTLIFKMNNNKERMNNIINDINVRLLKNIKEEQKNGMDVDLLELHLRQLRGGIQEDNNIDLQRHYNSLIKLIFNYYIQKKSNEINDIENGGIISKNQIAWVYNLDQELFILKNIINEKYFNLDEQNSNIIIEFYLDLIRLNLMRIKQEGYIHIRYTMHDDLPMNVEKNKFFDIVEWIKFSKKMYQTIPNQIKQDFINELYKKSLYEIETENYYVQFCRECISELLIIEIDGIFLEKNEYNEFFDIFGSVIENEFFNEIYIQRIGENFISLTKFDAKKIVNQLSEKNCTYLFIYIISYYSINKLTNWKFINVKLLENLWERHISLQNNATEIIEQMRKSNIGHKFTKEMYFKLVEYINSNVSDELYNKVNNEKIFDVFYIWIIKTCVTNQNSLVLPWIKNLEIDVQIEIFNKLAEHDELMENENVYNWIESMRYESFSNLYPIPKNLTITLRTLFLTNICIKSILKYVHEKGCLYQSAFGAYLLVKMYETPCENQDEVKEIVKGAFINSNQEIDDYVKMIKQECYACRSKLNYVPKEKMKEYLLNIL